jgi:hypothetical protein
MLGALDRRTPELDDEADDESAQTLILISIYHLDRSGLTAFTSISAGNNWEYAHPPRAAIWTSGDRKQPETMRTGDHAMGPNRAEDTYPETRGAEGRSWNSAMPHREPARRPSTPSQEDRHMKRWISILAVAAMTMLVTSPAWSGSSATQTVTFEVQAINEITASGNPGALTISTATAGSQPDDATDATTTYNITTNGTTKKITGAVDVNMPANVTLKANLTAPTGGTSAGATTLTTVAADLVTGITQKAETAKTITYTLSATVAAGVVASDTRTVTLTVADGV